MSVLNNKKILNASKLSLILNRLASQLFENHNDFSEVVLICLQPRGTILSKKLKQLIEKNYSIKNVNLGFLDVGSQWTNITKTQNCLQRFKIDS